MQFSLTYEQNVLIYDPRNHYGGGGGGVLVDGHEGPEYSDRRGQGYGGGGSGGSNETFGNPGLVLVEVETT